MAKPLTKEQIQLKKMRRLKSKSLRQLLLYRFLNHYGYDKGEITAIAIIDDILKLIDEYFLVSSIDDDLHHIHYGQMVWMAVPVGEYPQKGKSIAQTRLKPVVLSFVTDDDISHISHGFDSKTLRKKRLIRWVDETFDQGALLTQLDLAILPKPSTVSNPWIATSAITIESKCSGNTESLIWTRSANWPGSQNE